MEWLFLFVVLGWMFFRVVFAKIGDVLYTPSDVRILVAWDFPETTNEYSKNIILIMLQHRPNGYITLWWLSLDENTKKNMDRQIYNAFQKRLKEPLIEEDKKFLKDNLKYNRMDYSSFI